MVGASPEFCLPCTSCGDTFDSLRLLRKHKCGFTQNTTADIKLGNVPENKTPTIVDKIKVETMIDLQKGSCLDPIQICEATLETIDNKNVIAVDKNDAIAVDNKDAIAVDNKDVIALENTFLNGLRCDCDSQAMVKSISAQKAQTQIHCKY